MVILLQDLPDDMAASPAEKNVGAAGEISHHSGNGEWTEQPVLVVLFISKEKPVRLTSHSILIWTLIRTRWDPCVCR